MTCFLSPGSHVRIGNSWYIQAANCFLHHPKSGDRIFRHAIWCNALGGFDTNDFLKFSLATAETIGSFMVFNASDTKDCVS